MALRLLVEAMKRGQSGVFFTLEYTEVDVAKLFSKIDVNPEKFSRLFQLDNSDMIDVPYIVRKLEYAASGTLIVIDYLQLLDQRRRSPTIADQLRALKSFAGQRGLIVVLTSQIDRSYELSAKPFPDLGDVRMPNPLDVALFTKACFMRGGEMQMQSSGA